MDNLELIEAYFNDELAQEEKRDFERRITIRLRSLRKKWLFIFLSKQVASAERAEEREKFRHLYKHGQPGNHAVKHEPALLRKLWPWAAAAAVLAGIIFGWYTWFKPVSLRKIGRQVYKRKFSKSAGRDGTPKKTACRAGLRLV